ncbi:MAG: tRNA (guanosine(37)-N1)-methyltransferase TrmD [Clostridia bacterium]|nr:tRNA (guanosine(37)-N1)-methyltransferase TrmD [Clostridia bacterium]
MKVDILTLFPEMFTPLNESIIGRAVKAGKIEINIYDIRNYTKDKHKKCDDYPFGGGAGMVMTAQPIADAIKAIDPNHTAKRIFTSPKGKVFTQKMVKGLIECNHIIILCGHYEGVDQRVIDKYIDEEISIGDFVLTGGELPAMVITDCLARYVDGVISSDSLNEESISSGLLEYPHYTRPQEFEGVKVPDVLVSGNHQEVDKWRYNESVRITKEKRPDLLEQNKNK